MEDLTVSAVTRVLRAVVSAAFFVLEAVANFLGVRDRIKGMRWDKNGDRDPPVTGK
ncbi:hypothetical protein ABZ865_14775 [Streptomyces sp. NPDC047085]|uniref:hypothetical protein n=1 Tax=Streptomyces sp. NPDC047085 TaxID=3155140 RepID=UPI0033C7996F